MPTPSYYTQYYVILSILAISTQVTCLKYKVFWMLIFNSHILTKPCIALFIVLNTFKII